ncbi:hypothetical protein K6112_00130 [Methylophilales bacterium]|nr:hypothetical protein K6112_00130 [Methylophilales bacterium]
MTKLIGVLFSVFFLFISNNIYAYSNSPHEIPDKLTMSFTGNSFKTYLNLLAAVNIDPGKTITEKFKKKFRINGKYIDKNGSEVLFKGKARITGDWKDHIGKNGFSSLSISLKKSNIGGVTNFRLLLPETKGGIYEIFWSSLMEEIGFPVPLRKYIDVNIFNSNFTFIFEEKPEKEFLESIGIREAPIVEVDERQFWELNKSSNVKDPVSKLVGSFFYQNKVKNKDFIKNDISQKISLKAISLISSDFKNLIIDDFNKLNKAYASHGLNWHNRKFIYDPIYNDYIPIYFDGMIYIKKMKSDCTNFNLDNYNNDVKKKINVLNSMYFDRTLKKYNLTNDMKCIAAKFFNQKISSSLTKIKAIEPIKFNDKKAISSLEVKIKKQEKSIRVWPDIVEIKPNDKLVYRLKYDDKSKVWEKNKEIEYKELNKYLIGDDKPKTVKNFKIYDLLSISYPFNHKESFNEINAINQSLDIQISPNETKYIKLSASNSIINITLQNQKSKIIFYQASFKDSKVFIHSNANKSEKINENLVRYDSRLITSCASFIDSSVHKTFISSLNCQLEDGLNFLRTNGSDVSININNSLFDGLDADFSTLTFNEINIQNSGNDCIDVSAGTYNFKKINADTCADKAISIGEKSLVAINNAIIKNANIGLAVKDLSEVSLNSIKQSNVEDCINVYQKKQEFGPGTIILDKKINDCSVKLKNGSKLVKGKSCMKVEKNYFYNICIKNESIQVAIKKPLPYNSLFYLNVMDGKTKKIKNLNSFIQKNYKATCKVNEPCDLEVKIENQYVNMGLYDNDLGIYSLKEFH